MWNDDNTEWSAAHLALIEASLWQEDQRRPTDLAWLDSSWQDPVSFWNALHAYSDRRQASPSKSTPWVRYDFYHDLLARHQDPTKSALIWLAKGQWHTWSYAELTQTVNGLAATWEMIGVQPGETLAILHPSGPQWLAALLAGLRLGLIVSILPPQGDAFVSRRLDHLQPQWLAIDHLYRHQLAEVWQDKVLPNTLSPLTPVRRSYVYPGAAIVAQCLDTTSPTIELPCPVDADTLYLGALRDGILALGIKPGQVCAAPGWHVVESQPSLILAVLLSGATWMHIDFADLEQEPERLLEQPIDVLGISRSLRDLLLRNPLAGKKSWRYWFRHPAESADFTLWQDFIQDLQLQETYSGNVLWNAARGGALLFSSRCRGQTQLTVLPAAGLCWQLGIIDSPDLPCLGGWGQMALGKAEKDKTVWMATPFILAPYLQTWNYLGQYPRGRAGRTYPQQEVLDLLSNKVHYQALVEASMYGGDADPRQVLLVFGKDIDTAALQASIKTELGAEFLPDSIECLPLLPLRNKVGGADQAWCQQHYLSGELYRRQRSTIFCCVSELKELVLG
ncbi:MAG: AMP-binding protein [Methylococcaceae bacterium]